MIGSIQGLKTREAMKKTVEGTAGVTPCVQRRLEGFPSTRDSTTLHITYGQRFF